MTHDESVAVADVSGYGSTSAMSDALRLPAVLCLSLILVACGAQPDNSAQADQGITVDLSASEATNVANVAQPEGALLNAAAPPAVPEAPDKRAQPEKVKADSDATPPADEPDAPASTSAEAPKEDPAPPATQDAAPSRPPVSNTEMARTIQRIGFSCGEVVSTERVLTDAGAVFKINCSSGQSYRGSTSQGRMRFRRWTDE